MIDNRLTNTYHILDNNLLNRILKKLFDWYLFYENVCSSLCYQKFCLINHICRNLDNAVQQWQCFWIVSVQSCMELTYWTFIWPCLTFIDSCFGNGYVLFINKYAINIYMWSLTFVLQFSYWNIAWKQTNTELH